MTKVAHWCCTQCGRAVVPVGAQGVQEAFRAHLVACRAATFSIKMLTQGS